MSGTGKPQQPRGTALRAVAVFLISYFLFLGLWILVKDAYGSAVVFVASKAAAGVKYARFEEMTLESDTIEATFSHLRTGPEVLIDIPLKTSAYTFNAPLTFAIVAALSLSIRRRPRAALEAAAILFCIHLLYVFSREVKELTDVFVGRGIESGGGIGTVLSQFLWSFTDNMVIRFEPFLIGLYLYIRFRR